MSPGSSGATLDPLLAPVTLPCGLVLANRMLKSATSELLATDHRLPTAAHARLYARWAEGGAGALVTGNVMVDDFRRVARGDVALTPRSPLAPFRAWAAASRAPLLMQLSHPGRQTPRGIDPAPVAPSPLRVRRGWVVFAEPRALIEEEILGLVTAFADGAALAHEAAFAGVQLHAAHGYLLHQFLSPRTNRRTDGWGGSPAGRRRVLESVVRAIRARVPAGFAVSVKLNVPPPGASREELDEWCELLRSLAGEGVDLLELSGGTYERDALFGKPAEEIRTLGVRHEARFAAEAAIARRTVATPLALTGGIRSVRGARRVIESDLADVVGLARWLILEPTLPDRIGRGLPIAAPDLPRPLGLRAAEAPAELAWFEDRLRALAAPPGARPTAPPSRARAVADAVRKLVW